MATQPFSTGIMDKIDRDKTKIIQILNEIQRNFGFLPMSELQFISTELSLPLSKIWGIISFYSHYKLNPPADFEIRVCSGTACHVKNSKMLRDTFEKEIDDIVKYDVNTESVACLGCCALAPVFEVNGEVHGKMNTTKVKELVEKIKGDIR